MARVSRRKANSKSKNCNSVRRNNNRNSNRNNSKKSKRRNNRNRNTKKESKTKRSRSKGSRRRRKSQRGGGDSGYQHGSDCTIPGGLSGVVVQTTKDAVMAVTDENGEIIMPTEDPNFCLDKVEGRSLQAGIGYDFDGKSNDFQYCCPLPPKPFVP